MRYDVCFDAIAPATANDTAQQNDLCTAWADIQKIGVWKNPKSVFYMGLYKTI